MKNISIIGKVNGNIFTQQFESGAVGGRIPVIVSESWETESDDRRERETHFTVEVWNNTALFCADRFKDGDAIFIDGDLKVREYNRQSDNALQARIVIAAHRVLPMGDTDETYIRFRGIGNLGADPEMRYTNEAGIPVTNARIAFNRRFKDSAGEPQEDTLWADMTTWNGLAENLDQYTRRGSKLYVEGERVELDFYKTKEGEDRVKFVMTASFIQFLDRAPSDGAPAGAPAGDGSEQQGDDMPW